MGLVVDHDHNDAKSFKIVIVEPLPSSEMSEYCSNYCHNLGHQQFVIFCKIHFHGKSRLLKNS